MLNIVRNLCQALNDKGVTYCHWKSNLYLDEALSGKDDIDLLVSLEDAEKLHSVLEDTYFKLFVPSTSDSDPGVYHYFGLDEETGNIVHVHLYHSIVTGGDLVKNYKLPLEKMVFQNLTHKDGVPIPRKSAELILFVIRMFLKAGSVLNQILLNRERDQIKKELVWLYDKDTREESIQLLTQYVKVIEPELFQQCIITLEKGAGFMRKLILGKIVRRRFRFYKRIDGIKCSIIEIYRLTHKTINKLLGKRKTFKPFKGGLVIAIVGPEASGKSTIANEIRNWLGKQFYVLTIHAGKPPSTWLTLLPNFLLPILKIIFSKYRTSIIEDEDLISSEIRVKRKASLMFVTRALMIAYDRYKLLTRAHKKVVRDQLLVLSDRYPTRQVGAIDSAQIDCLVKEILKSRLLSFLSKKENNLYTKIPCPNLVVRLMISVEKAVERNKTRKKDDPETEQYVRWRHMHSSQINFHDSIIHTVNTEQSLDNVLLSIKRFLWQYV